MGIFKKKKIFISHRRNSGQATTEAILVKENLSKDANVEVFMDVTEDYLGSFPNTLKDRIKRSDAFVLILPKSENYDYLCDPNNWVHKEIHYALTFKDALNKPNRIVPVTFDRDFRFPSKELLGDIADIADYSFILYDTNNKDSYIKLKNAVGIKTRINLNWLWITIFVSIVLACILAIYPIPKRDVQPKAVYSYKETNDFVNSLESYDSFQMFTDSCDKPVNKYVTWYLGEVNNGSEQYQKNVEFNEAYIKDYCIRLAVLAYHAFTTGRLDDTINNDEIKNFIELCYKNIPEDSRYPISLKQKSKEERTQEFEKIIDVTVETLNNDPRIKSIDESMLPVLKSTLKSKLWPF